MTAAERAAERIAAWTDRVAIREECGAPSTQIAEEFDRSPEGSIGEAFDEVGVMLCNAESAAEELPNVEIAQAIRAAFRKFGQLRERVQQECGESEWVSVAERLPDKGREILLWCVPRQGKPFMYTGKQAGNLVPSNVTHWRPLPAPPQAAQPSAEKESSK